MNKYKKFLGRTDLVKNQVEREKLAEQEAVSKRKRSIQQQNRQRFLKYQEQLRSELAARYFHSVQSTGGDADAQDADAQAFITVASITDSTQQSAINTFVTDLKGYGIWTKMKAIYPFVGGTASSHKYNLKDPQDTDAAFRLVFNGGWTHNATGALPNGTNGWADTFVKTGTDLALNSTHVSVYLRTDTAAADRLAIGNCFGGANFELSLWVKHSGNSTSHRNNTNTNSTVSDTDSRGFYIGNRNSSTQQKIIKNNTINTFSANSVATTNTRTINISSALSAYNTTRAYYNNKEYALSSIGDGLTDTEAANLYTAVQAFQTTLSRQV